MFLYVKLTAEFKKIGVVISKSSPFPVWRHQLGIWANLGKFQKTPIATHLNVVLIIKMTYFM